MKTNFRSLSGLFRAAKKLAAVCTFVTAITSAAAGQNTFPANGNVGIGTTTPAIDLEVRGGSVNSRVTASGTTGANGKFQLFSADITNNPFGEMQLFAPTGAGSEYLRFNFGNSSGNIFADVMTINRLGNVGIGTSSPGGNIDVRDASGRQLLLTNSATGGHTFLNSANNAHLSGNLYWNQTSWNRFDTTRGGVLVNARGDLGVIDFITMPAGANPVASSNTAMRIDNNGNVGIGTTSPIYKLQVLSGNGQFLSGDPTGSQLFFQVRPSSGKQGWLAFTEDGVADRWAVGIKNNDSKLYFSSGNIGSLTDRMSLDANGNLSVSGNINAKYQDLAEWVPSSEQLSAGTVVVLDSTKSHQVVSSNAAYDTRVAGVISAQPGITLGEGGEGKVLVATTGRVRVKVDASRGPIQIGDLLVTSDVTGVAMKSEAVNLGGVQIHRPGTIIGKALEPLAKGSGEILVLLSLQ